MRYETLISYKGNKSYSGSGLYGDSETYTFTFNNNIDHIVKLFFKTSNYLAIDTITISGNVLTVVASNTSTSAQSGIYSIILATVATY